MSFNGGNADEVLNITPAVTGNYYIHADCHTLGSGNDHSYQLLIYPDDTAPDAYEANDSINTAKTIVNNIPVSGTINIGTDEDWYAFNVDNAGKLTITLDSIPNNCDFDLEIYDGSSNILSGSYLSGNANEKTDALVNTGNYYVRIYSYSGSSECAYNLNVNLSIPDKYEVNDSVLSAKEVFVDSSSFGTIDNIKDEDYFRVDIEETENYVFELQNIPSSTDYDLSLFDSSGNAVAYSWSSSNYDELVNISLNPGYYYIKIHSYSGFSCEQNYMLSVYKQDALTLAMPYIRANVGDTVSVPVGIQNLPTEGLCSFDFTVDYDATAMTYLGYTIDYSDPNSAIEDTEQVIEANKECDGVLKILYLDNSVTFTKPLNKAGILIRLNFQINMDTSDGAYDISCSYGSFAKGSSEGAIAISHAIFKHGLIMIGSYGLTSLQADVKAQNLVPMANEKGKLGDMDWDGKVTSVDFAIYRKYLLGMILAFPNVPTGHSSDEVADVNGDGNTDSLDFGLIRQYLLGMIAYFPAQTLRVPTVTLDSPSNGSTYAVGQKVYITGTGRNCDHIAVFINNNWVETQDGNYFSYYYTIPYAGSFSICLKGRNVPGSSEGTLHITSSITIQGIGNQPTVDGKVMGSQAYIDMIDKVMDDEAKKYWNLTPEYLVKTVAAAGLKKIMTDVKNNSSQLDNISEDNFIRLCKKVNSLVWQYGSVYQELHYFRNYLNRSPETLGEMIQLNKSLSSDKKWRLLPPSDSMYHMYGTNGEYNVKLVSAEGFFEAVYNKNGTLLTQSNDPVNMGTYNYADPDNNKIKHGLYDVEPYYLWGNIVGVPKPSIPATENLDRYNANSDAQRHYNNILNQLK